jgi:hypothetical protein
MSAARLLPGEGYRRLGREVSVEQVRLGMLMDRPVYRFATEEHGWITVAADDGSVLPELDAGTAASIAQRFIGSGERIEYRGLWREPDQWTIYFSWAPYLQSRPFSAFHKFAMGDAAGTEVSVLAGTGDVTQVTTRAQRHWGQLRALLHRIKPKPQPPRHAAVWAEIVIWRSGVGTVLCLSGLVLGLYFLRWRRAPGVSASRYRGMLRWHHYLGLAFGVVACTWVFSGLLSMDPWDWSAVEDSPLDAQERLRGGPLELDAFVLAPAAAEAACDRALSTKEIRLVQWLGEPYYLCVESPERTALISARRGGGQPFARLSTDTIAAGVSALMPQQSVTSVDLLADYDGYYHPGWEEKTVDDGAKRLPVVRIDFADPRRTVVYIDPQSAAAVGTYDTSSRRLRWLFNGLHSLDFPALYGSRPLWDVAMLAFMLGGLLLCGTGVWVGAKWLARTARPSCGREGRSSGRVTERRPAGYP